MTTEELVTIIELRQKLKHEISEDMFNEIKPLNLDPTYELDILDQNTVVKKHISEYYYMSELRDAYDVFEKIYTNYGYIIHRHMFDHKVSDSKPYKFRFIVWFSNPD